MGRQMRRTADADETFHLLVHDVLASEKALGRVVRGHAEFGRDEELDADGLGGFGDGELERERLVCEGGDDDVDASQDLD